MQFLLGKSNQLTRPRRCIQPVSLTRFRATPAHNYDVQLPGYASDAIRIEQNKADLKAIATSIPPSRASRLNAVQQAKSGAKVRG